MTHAEMAALLSMDDNYRVLRRLGPLPDYSTPEEGGEKRIAALIDVETTGLDPAHDKIIELGMLLLEYGSDGQIYDVLSPYSQWFEDPGVPIPAEITKINGIADDMVVGKQIDDAEIDRLLPAVSLVIAHNAAFDRPFVEKRCPGFVRKAWGCSMNAIDWQAEGCTSRSLEFLAFKSGIFYDGHRSIVDCQALLHILAQPLPISRRPALAALLDAERALTWRVWARGAPFEAKDILKRRGCTWSPGENGRPKSWYRDVAEDTRDAEATWLRANAGVREVWGMPITASKRYSDRCWEWGQKL